MIYKQTYYVCTMDHRYLSLLYTVVTGYTPGVVALTDMLRTQLSITRSMVARSRQLATRVSESISANHHYTTLEETKQVYIIIDVLIITIQCMYNVIIRSPPPPMGYGSGIKVIGYIG